jgi:cell division protein FtsI/penicillin-binding protein 2
VSVEWGIAEGVVWPYQTSVELRHVDGAWRVVFEPSILHPGLVAGDRLVVQPLEAPRGSILGGHDEPIVGPQAPEMGFAQALLGTVGEVTTAQLTADPGRYLPGERVGQSGLQELFDGVLRGRPGAVVSVAGAADVLYRADATAGAALHTTLDQHVQAAAHAALGGQAGVSALVAVRISDGTIVAVANGGDRNLAFTASAPGAVFTIVTALGLLTGAGLTAGSPVPCPATFTAGGRTFTSPDPGTRPLREALTCDTALASLATNLGSDGLARAAASLGIGTTWHLGVPVETGSVPRGLPAGDAAAAALGLGQTMVSPVALAVATATVARGSWRTPRLFPSLPPGASPPAAGPAGDPPDDGEALPEAAVAALHEMTREAAAAAGLPGNAVHAQAGRSATDTWVTGWQGDYAFAVLVQGGAGAVAITAAFLRELG